MTKFEEHFIREVRLIRETLKDIHKELKLSNELRINQIKKGEKE